MTSFSAISGSQVMAERYDFSKVRTVVDVAGGEGSFLVQLLNAHSHLRGVASRCEPVGGRFFESVPAGHDVYMMIIHDWADDQAVRILRTCRQAMRADSRLLLIEQLIPEQKLSGFQMFIDLTMMAMFGSKEHTAKEFQALFARAGAVRLRSVERLCP
ncbi:O-methyltransferase family 2 [Corallococcus macrosporus]|uniref:O-methyltransferase family 2 n=1 Tax=Myxococcus fulvus (strain ATCC BAA-855 / HW-1) TaxID=483219 RepID=F8CHH0_MYXFH|nr:O-methyltransferase family 2 [Corallococcus macrosporus]